jgi:hypothetical protein
LSILKNNKKRREKTVIYVNHLFNKSLSQNEEVEKTRRNWRKERGKQNRDTHRAKRRITIYLIEYLIVLMPTYNGLLIHDF